MKELLKVGDSVMLSLEDKSAYAGFEGKVLDIFEDGGFSIHSGSSILILPRINVFGRRKYYWIYVNGKLVCY